MSDTTTLFSGAPADQLDPSKDYLADLVGEGKKFKDAAALAYGKMQSDIYISQLEREKAELFADLKARQTLEDTLSKLQNTPNQPKAGEPAAGGSVPENTAFNEEQIEKLISERLNTALQKQSAEAVAANNVNVVRAELEKVWGSEYLSKLKQATDALGLGENFVTALAREKPQALLKILFTDKPNTPSAPTSVFAPTGSGVNTAALHSSTAGKPPEEERYSYWQSVRQKQPQYYHSPAAASLRFAAAKKHGEAFYAS